MPADILYIDSSALVKLVLPEKETVALFRLLLSWPYRLVNHIGFVEVHRAVRRASADREVLRRVEEVLSSIHFMETHMGILGDATLLEPFHLRSLDAIHLATAYGLRHELGAFVNDRRMADGARSLNLKVLSPT
ncbi:MAG TPA: type II toxin-antitoxin system VapC family toxin [Thermoanaerobaculia bacterium]